MSGLERARRRRRRRSVTVLVVATLMVLGGFAYALAYWNGMVGGSSTEASPTCTPAPTTTPPESRFTVNVYNSSKRSGEADKFSDALKSRDFTVGAVGNDPYKKKLSGVGEIRFGPAGRAYAERFLQPLLPGATMAQDGRTGTNVDVAIGEQFPTVPTRSATPTPSASC